MPPSISLPWHTTTTTASPFVPRFCPSSQLRRPPSSLRNGLPSLRPNNAFVCEIAVELDGIPSTEDQKDLAPAVGSRIRVSEPLRVFHVPKKPEFDLAGCEGEIKDVLKSWKGKPLSANLPYKVQFVLDIEGKQVKFFAHLKEGEFEVI